MLQEFGFGPDSSLMSDVQPGLRFNFGNFTLSASAVLSRWLQPVVLFTGVLTTSRTITEICFEMPRSEMSNELIAAWIVSNLDNAASGGRFNAMREPDWLALGRQHQHLLPWEIARAESAKEAMIYAARDHCTVDRRVLRFSLNALAELLTKSDPADQVTIDFDGRVLSFRCHGVETLMGATGDAWPCQYRVPAESLSKNLPKRLRQSQVEVGIWKTTLEIDRSRFELTLATQPDAA